LIESASNETGLPMGVLAVGIPASPRRGISVQLAIHVMQIIGGKPL
jgi:hypothetical protein